MAVALPRPPPAAHQHGHLVVPADERGELARAGAAAAAARANEPKQRDWLRHPLERVSAAFFDDKEARDLVLDLRGDQDRAGLGERLHPGRDIGHVAINLAGRVDHRWTGVEPDARNKLRLAGAPAAPSKAAIARKILRRWPSKTPSFSRS